MHIPILMHIPALPRLRPLTCIPRPRLQLLLAALPLLLPLSFPLHLAFEQRFRGPAASLCFLLRGETSLILEVDFCGGGVILWTVGGGLLGWWSGIGGEEAGGAGGVGLVCCGIREGTSRFGGSRRFGRRVVVGILLGVLPFFTKIVAFGRVPVILVGCFRLIASWQSRRLLRRWRRCSTLSLLVSELFELSLEVCDALFL